jgi:RNA polymerase sigma factor (TIGR02999 family)
MRTKRPVAQEPAASASELVVDVYEELRRLAARYLRREARPISLEPAELVHEAFVRLCRIDRMVWKGRSHFYAMAATEMRRVLVERARVMRARKRCPPELRLSYAETMSPSVATDLEVLAVDEGLAALARGAPRQARVAEMRLFAGMSVEEIAEQLGVSGRTIKADWQLARAWLAGRLRH